MHDPHRFNSLQTGKHIESRDVFRDGQLGRVSIPFKRESTLKEEKQGRTATATCTRVSIPFKRESTLKVCETFQLACLQA